MIPETLIVDWLLFMAGFGVGYLLCWLLVRLGVIR
jgi:hypothetical protein